MFGQPPVGDVGDVRRPIRDPVRTRSLGRGDDQGRLPFLTWGPPSDEDGTYQAISDRGPDVLNVPDVPKGRASAPPVERERAGNTPTPQRPPTLNRHPIRRSPDGSDAAPQTAMTAELYEIRPWTAREQVLLDRIPVSIKEDLSGIIRIRALFDADLVAIETLSPRKDSKRHANA